MFDDLVLVLQEYTSEYEGRYQEDKTKSEVCQEKKLHLYSEILFPISLYLFPISSPSKILRRNAILLPRLCLRVY
jgi:hypothetical protein